MSAWNEALLIMGMMLVTFGVRYPLLALSGRFQFPDRIIELLRFVPVVVLSAICVPMLLAPEKTLWIGFDNEYLIAGVAAVAIAAFSRHLLLTIALGMSLFLVLRFM